MNLNKKNSKVSFKTLKFRLKPVEKIIIFKNEALKDHLLV
jgi:hypothetical protein